MTATTVTSTFSRIEHQQRLKSVTKCLTIELGYLEHCLAAGLQDANLSTAAKNIDTAIDCLNTYLTGEPNNRQTGAKDAALEDRSQIVDTDGNPLDINHSKALSPTLQASELPDIVDALVQIHGRIPVADALLTHLPVNRTLTHV